jgi:hypothetical protein
MAVSDDPKYAAWVGELKGIHIKDQPKDLFGADDAEKKEV